MQKKQIKCLCVGLFILNLSACASSDVYAPIEKITESENSRIIFVDSSIARFMGNADYIKLQSLIATAQPKQMVGWYSGVSGVYFEFLSKEIFVNAEGDSCRDYQIKLIRRFSAHSVFNYTACRDSQGAWQVITPPKS